MRHRRTGTTLDRSSAPRRALLRQLATSLVLYEHVNTTVAKARAMRPLVERLISRGKDKTLASRRYLIRFLDSESAVNKILEELGPRYSTRPGGYTRVIKLGVRKGDGAEVAQIQLVK